MNSRRYEDLFLHELKDLHSAETQLAKFLPKVVEAAHDPDLRDSLHSTLATTRAHFARLTRLRKDFGINLRGHRCDETARGLEKARSLMVGEAPGAIRDVGLVTEVQRIEHFGITRYTTAQILAARLGLEGAANLLSETIEEKKADVERLAKRAQSLVEFQNTAVAA